MAADSEEVTICSDGDYEGSQNVRSALQPRGLAAKRENASSRESETASTSVTREDSATSLAEGLRLLSKYEAEMDSVLSSSEPQDMSKPLCAAISALEDAFAMSRSAETSDLAEISCTALAVGHIIAEHFRDAVDVLSASCVLGHTACGRHTD